MKHIKRYIHQTIFLLVLAVDFHAISANQVPAEDDTNSAEEWTEFLSPIPTEKIQVAEESDLKK